MFRLYTYNQLQISFVDPVGPLSRHTPCMSHSYPEEHVAFIMIRNGNKHTATIAIDQAIEKGIHRMSRGVRFITLYRSSRKHTSHTVHVYITMVSLWSKRYTIVNIICQFVNPRPSSVDFVDTAASIVQRYNNKGVK